MCNAFFAPCSSVDYIWHVQYATSMNRRHFNKVHFQLISWGYLGAMLNACTSDQLQASLVLPASQFPATLPAGLSFPICWESEGSQTLKLELSIDGGQSWSIQDGNISAFAGKYLWSATGAPTATNILRLVDTRFPELTAQSPPFTVSATLSIPLTTFAPAISAQGFANTFIPSLGTVFILNAPSASEYLVIKEVCPHQDCSVNYFPNQETFCCPCHGSSFNQQGCLRNGPAEEGLTSFESVLSDDGEHLLIIPASGQAACD